MEVLGLGVDVGEVETGGVRKLVDDLVNESDSLAVTYPDDWQVDDAPFTWGERTDDFAELVSSPDASGGPIAPDLRISHTRIGDGVLVEVANYGDWSVTYRRSNGGASLDVTLAQGSPFVYRRKAR